MNPCSIWGQFTRSGSSTPPPLYSFCEEARRYEPWLQNPDQWDSEDVRGSSGRHQQTLLRPARSAGAALSRGRFCSWQAFLRCGRHRRAPHHHLGVGSGRPYRHHRAGGVLPRVLALGNRWRGGRSPPEVRKLASTRIAWWLMCHRPHRAWSPTHRAQRGAGHRAPTCRHISWLLGPAGTALKRLIGRMSMGLSPPLLIPRSRVRSIPLVFLQNFMALSVPRARKALLMMLKYFEFECL